MSAYRVDATLTDDGTVTLKDLPFQAGDSVEIIIVSRAETSDGKISNLLRGKVIHYDNPTDPVALDDWGASH